DPGVARPREARSEPVDADADAEGRDVVVDAPVRAVQEAPLQVDREALRRQQLEAGRAHEGGAVLRLVRADRAVEVLVLDLEVREADAALDPELRGDPVLPRDHQRALDERGLTEPGRLERLRVDLDLTHQREARAEEAAEVHRALPRERAVVAVDAL